MRDEDCIKISRDILPSVVNKDIENVNVHKTGNNNKDEPIIVKVFSKDDKIRILKNSKKVLF